MSITAAATTHAKATASPALVMPYIPPGMAERQQWLMWRFEGEGEKPRKVPCYANGMNRYGAQGCEQDRRRLVTAEEAWIASQRCGAEGIGFAFLPGDGLIGIDLDKMFNPETGEIAADAREIIDQAATYCELSPSGTGFHLIVSGECETFKDNGIGIEVFCGRQFFTWTGNCYGEPLPVRPLPESLLSWLRERVQQAKRSKAGPSTAPVVTGGSTAYGQAALDDAALKVAGAQKSTRNETLNSEAFCIAQLVAGGEIARNEAWARLSGAGLACGLDEREVATTLRSAFVAGEQKPRTAPDHREAIALGMTTQDAESSEWPAPTPLPAALLPVPEFPGELLPARLLPWVSDIAERVQCAPEFVAVPVMVALGSLIGRRVGIRPQAFTDWTETANLWGCIVGRPGCLKSPALTAALAPLERLAARARSAHEEQSKQDAARAVENDLRVKLALTEARKRLKHDRAADVTSLLSAPETIATPPARRYSTHDSSYQALAELLTQNPNGLLVIRDELVSLLAALDAEDAAEARGFYLSGWNGNQGYTVDRIGRGLNRHVDAVCLSMIGGTQPSRLAAYINAANHGGAGDDGLIQRFGLLVWPDQGGEWRDIDRWPDHEAKRAAFAIFDHLDMLDAAAIGAEQDTDYAGEPSGMPFLRFAPDALEAFLGWRTQLEQQLRHGDQSPALESHFAKYRKAVPAIALICHLADGGTGPVVLEATLRAIAWAEYLEPHARRAYSSGPAHVVQAARAILARIRSKAIAGTFAARDVYRNGWGGLTVTETVLEALALLEDHDYLQGRRLATGGRSAVVYSVNPRLLP